MTRFPLAVVPVVALAVVAACGREAAHDAPSPGVETAVSHRAAALDWETDLDEAVARARVEGRPVLASFYADWCVWCRRLDSTTLRDPRVAALIAERLVPARLDVDRGGKEASRRYGVDGLPTLIVLAPDGEELGRIPGYMPPGAFYDALAGMLPAGSPS